MTGFIGIGGYKKGYLVETWVFLWERCIGRGIQKKYFGRYLLRSSEIRVILLYPMNETCYVIGSKSGESMHVPYYRTYLATNLIFNRRHT
jgi:hypothetical protein